MSLQGKGSGEGSQRTSMDSQLQELHSNRFTYAYLHDYFRGSLHQLATYDGIIIASTNSIYTFDLLEKIRAHFTSKIFLKPIFLHRNTSVLDDKTRLLSDGLVPDLSKLSQVEYSTDQILQKLDQIIYRDQGRLEQMFVSGLLAYMYTRNIAMLMPKIDPACKSGFFYPVVSAIDRRSQPPFSSLAILELAETEGLLMGHFDQSAYVCSECQGGFLHFREICPSCQSSNLRTEDVVHHFRCAHVAPASDFRKAGGGTHMMCPKCHHELKHIGVDFDKPSSMHRCQNCYDQFQHYAVKARCTSCNHDQDVEHLLKKNIKRYELSDKGKMLLLNGRSMHDLQGPGKHIEHTMEWSLFIQALSFQLGGRYGTTHHLVKLSFLEYPSVVKQVGRENEDKLLQEIISIIKASQRNIDVRSIRLPDIYFSLFQCDEEEAISIAQRTVFLIHHLLRDNLRIKKDILDFSCVSLTKDVVHKLDTTSTTTDV